MGSGSVLAGSPPPEAEHPVRVATKAAAATKATIEVRRFTIEPFIESVNVNRKAGANLFVLSDRLPVNPSGARFRGKLKTQGFYPLRCA
jgi:hypothetical protein